MPGSYERRVVAGGAAVCGTASSQCGRPVGARRPRPGRLRPTPNPRFPDRHAASPIGFLRSGQGAFGEEGVEPLITATTQQQIEAYRARMPGPGSSLEQRVAALATVRVETTPGDQLQIDFCQKRLLLAGVRFVVFLLVAVLSSSRRLFRTALLNDPGVEWRAGLPPAVHPCVGGAAPRPGASISNSPLSDRPMLATIISRDNGTARCVAAVCWNERTNNSMLSISVPTKSKRIACGGERAEDSG